MKRIARLLTTLVALAPGPALAQPGVQETRDGAGPGPGSGEEAVCTLSVPPDPEASPLRDVVDLFPRSGRLHPVALAQDPPSDAAAPAQDKEDKPEESPWLALPIFSLNPKLGFSGGAMLGYLFYFDEASRVSTLGLTGQYTSTGSVIAGVVGRLSFSEDHQRLLALAVGGNIRNNYDDFLGTGVPLKSNDELRALAARYQYRVLGDWFVGAQAIATDYALIGDSVLDDRILDVLGLKGYRSAGLGAVIQYDSRDSEGSPTRGCSLSTHNVAYREWLSGSDNFDVYRLDFKLFIPEGGGHVLALRQFDQWTASAPPAAYAPIQLRGYKMGQYLGRNMSSIEAEERLRLAERWSVTMFAGIAFLYGNGQSLTDPSTRFPSAGAGLQFVLKEKEGLVANLEFAAGKGDNYGIYIKLGYGF